MPLAAGISKVIGGARPNLDARGGGRTVLLVYYGVTPQQQPGSYQGGE